jgi:beta-aspartyl-peptidase (threonine type)
VAGIRQIKNPITLARAVMEKSEHVMLTGDGADEGREGEHGEFGEKVHKII